MTSAKHLKAIEIKLSKKNTTKHSKMSESPSSNVTSLIALPLLPQQNKMFTKHFRRKSMDYQQQQLEQSKSNFTHSPRLTTMSSLIIIFILLSVSVNTVSGWKTDIHTHTYIFFSKGLQMFNIRIRAKKHGFLTYFSRTDRPMTVDFYFIFSRTNRLLVDF